jgi:hypothetical protein
VTQQVEGLRIGGAGEKFPIICPGTKLFEVDGISNLSHTPAKALGVHVNRATGCVIP